MEEVAQSGQQLPDARGLGCEDPFVELPEGRRQHQLTIKRVMTEEEWTAAQGVNGLLNSLVNTSYGRLMTRIEYFFAGIDEALRVLNTREGRSPDPPLRERFSEALFALRAFQDHMPHDLRKLFGGDRAAADVFEVACRAEYDRSFEYRLCHNLRNQAQHRQDVIEVKYHVAVVQPPDGVERRVDTFVTETLLDEAVAGDGKWQAQVRKDLKTRERPIRADQLLRSLQVSAARILAMTILSRRDEIERAIADVRKLAAEAGCIGRPALIQLGPPPQEGPPGSQKAASITRLQLETCDVLEKAMMDSDRLLWATFTVPIAPNDVGYGDFHRLLDTLAARSDVEPISFDFREGVGEFVTLRASSSAIAQGAVKAATAEVWPNDVGLHVGEAAIDN